MKMTYEQRTAASIVIKHRIETAIDNLHRVTNEFIWKQIEIRRFAKKIGGLNDRRN